MIAYCIYRSDPLPIRKVAQGREPGACNTPVADLFHGHPCKKPKLTVIKHKLFFFVKQILI